MLIILWFMVVCCTAGACKPHEASDDEIERVLNYLVLKDKSNIRNPNKGSSSKWYPRESSTSNPEGHCASITEYTTIYHSEDQQGEEYRYCEQPSENDYEQEYPIQGGPVRGIPGINFPNYKDIPLTHFRCSDKAYVPGYYADMETGCQVFHVCWPHRRESFLCPVGSIFNQAILACDYWYSSNCSLASHYYDINAVAPHTDPYYEDRESLVSLISDLLEIGKSYSMLASSKDSDAISEENIDFSEILKFLPVKAKVVVYPETVESPKIIAEASKGRTKKSKVVKQVLQKPQIHEVKPEYIKVLRPHGKVAPVQKVVPMKTEHSYKEIDRIIDGVFDIVMTILKETILKDIESSLPVLDNTQTRKPKESDSVKLNSRFITKPTKLPKQYQRSIRSTTPKVQKPHTPSRP